jgi:hypothetical protein
MKRFVVFLGLGPFIGYTVLFSVVQLQHPPAMSLNYANVATGALFAYVVGAPFAGMSAFTDWLLRRRAWRIVSTTIVGGATSAFLALAAYLKFGNATNFLVLAAVGAIPAAVCSWLSGRAA